MTTLLACVGAAAASDAPVPLICGAASAAAALCAVDDEAMRPACRCGCCCCCTCVTTFQHSLTMMFSADYGTCCVAARRAALDASVDGRCCCIACNDAADAFCICNISEITVGDSYSPIRVSVAYRQWQHEQHQAAAINFTITSCRADISTRTLY